jgi:hypothetical protein
LPVPGARLAPAHGSAGGDLPLRDDKADENDKPALVLRGDQQDDGSGQLSSGSSPEKFQVPATGPAGQPKEED